jgi:hypothetical protein
MMIEKVADRDGFQIQGGRARLHRTDASRSPMSRSIGALRSWRS